MYNLAIHIKYVVIFSDTNLSISGEPERRPYKLFKKLQRVQEKKAIHQFDFHFWSSLEVTA